jgi:hypothetical protein
MARKRKRPLIYSKDDKVLAQIAPGVAFTTWCNARARVYDLELRADADPVELAKAKIKLSNLSRIVERVYAVHAAIPPPELSELQPVGARHGGKRSEAAPPAQAPPVASEASAEPTSDPLAHLRPRRCASCGLVVDGVTSIDNGDCPNCSERGSIIVGTGRGATVVNGEWVNTDARWVRDLMSSGPTKVLAEATWGPRPLRRRPLTYGNFDPFMGY